MPAYVELDGGSFSLGYRLCDHLGSQVPPVLRFPVKEGFDVAWVRARIPRLFGFTPEPSEVEKALLYVGFAAVTTDGSVCFPFFCSDHYGKSALMFSDAGPAEIVKLSIANAFWETLVQEPDDLTDFEQRVYHPGAMVWLTYGCDAGRVYCDESEE
jgi:hypothetical protein